MPKSKKPPEKPKDQFKRFLEVAREHEVDDKGLDEAFKALASKNVSKSDKKRSD